VIKNKIKRDLAEFSQLVLGYSFIDFRLLEQAFTHRSFVNEETRKTRRNHNERLEFLGDAVLELIITDFLFLKYSEFPEGKLTAVRASLVNYRILGKLAKEMGFEDYLKLSRGELADNNERSRLPILADCFEAILGALYLDGGLQPCTKFLNNCLIPLASEIISTESYRDSKSKLQEFLQSSKKITPHYKILTEEGKEHQKLFTVAVFASNRQLSTGVGSSKQEAEIDAANNALKTIL
jgi:ribonuclease III